MERVHRVAAIAFSGSLQETLKAESVTRQAKFTSVYTEKDVIEELCRVFSALIFSFTKKVQSI